MGLHVSLWLFIHCQSSVICLERYTPQVNRYKELGLE